jgi:hypothetical protein
MLFPCPYFEKIKKLIGLWAVGAIPEFNTNNMYPYEEKE